MADNICRERSESYNYDIIVEDFNEYLYILDDLIKEASNFAKELKDFSISPPTLPRLNSLLLNLNPCIAQELRYNRNELQILTYNNYAMMNVDQAIAYPTICEHIDANRESIFFIGAPGGTVCSKYRSQGQIVCANASSGIAAILFTGGSTAHSRFGIPLNITETSKSALSCRDNIGKMLKECNIIIWNEAPMATKLAIEIVNKFLQLLMVNHNPFGWKLMIFSGDFRKILPVVPKGGRSDIIQSTIKRFYWWKDVITLSLTINERVLRNLNLASNYSVNAMQCCTSFCTFLLSIGNGVRQIHTDIGPDIIEIPYGYLFENETVSDFINWVYYGIHDIPITSSIFFTASILCSKNVYVDEINKRCLNLLQGQLWNLPSADSVMSEDSSNESINFPVEYLNHINLAGLPPHDLQQKINCPIILLQNLNPAKGLCNGTRLIVDSISKYILKATIINGSHGGATAIHE